MPRGLGEDPLSRHRKASRRAPLQAFAISSRTGDLSPLRSGQEGVEASSSRTSSHDDVFFKKRSDDVPAVAASEPLETLPERSASPSAAAPPTIEEPAAVGSAAAAPQLDILSAVPPVPPEQAQTMDVPAAQQEPAATEPQATVATSARPAMAESRPAPEEPRKGGFLKRLFERFGK